DGNTTLINNLADGDIYREIHFITESPINSFEESRRFSIIVNGAVHILRVRCSTRAASKDICAFRIDDGLSIEFSGIGGIFGWLQTFPHKVQLHVKESELEQSDRHKTESEKASRVVGKPLPTEFIWFTLGVGVVSFCAALGLCWITGVW